MNDHDVVLYGNDSSALTNCVVPVVASALQDGGAAVVVASEEHERAFRSTLEAVGVDSQSDAVADRLRFLNASETAKALMLDGRIEPTRFERLIGNPVRKLAERFDLCVYGEIVGVLRTWGKAQVAAELEDLWGRLLGDVPFRLLCGYPIDVLGAEFRAGEMDVILTRHTQLISALPTAFEPSLDAGLESAVGRQRAQAIRNVIGSARRPVWATLQRAEATLMWLRDNLPDQADGIIEGARIRASS